MYYFDVTKAEKPLDGEVNISGAKNAVLAVMAAALLADGVSEIYNIPHLKDVNTMSDVLRVLGCRVSSENHTLKIDTHSIDHLEAPYELVSAMRASFYVLGPLVARFGRCRVSLPGGCAWGPRPVDLHLKGLEALGAKITLSRGFVEATCEGRLPGGTFDFPVSSVGATVNLLMASTLADGTTVLNNAALEPEIDNLVDFLIDMGANISGRGTRTLVIHGVKELRPGKGATIPDRIEAGTFLCGAAITRGCVKVNNIIPKHIESVLNTFKDMGCKVSVGTDWAEVDARSTVLNPVNVTTLPFPGFPTDMQAPMMATLMSIPGNSFVQDTVYNDRFKHVPEFMRLGANIQVNGNTAIIKGGMPLEGTDIVGTDLRATAAMVLAALIADGKSTIRHIYHLDRGYEDFENKMAKIGASVVRLEDDTNIEE